MKKLALLSLLLTAAVLGAPIPGTETVDPDTGEPRIDNTKAALTPHTDWSALDQSGDVTAEAARATAAEAANAQLVVDEAARAQAAEALKADQTALDAQELKQDTHEQDDTRHNGAATTGQYSQKQPDGSWVGVDLPPISAANYIVGAGAPAPPLGDDGDYYRQLDAATGEANVWGPKAGGAWPAQADFKHIDDTAGTLPNFTDTDADYGVAKLQSPQVLDQWLESKSDQYIRAADGDTLEVGKRYEGSTGTVNTPANPQDGDYFYIKNDSSRQTIGGDLKRITVVGPIRTLDGSDYPGFAVGPGFEFVVTYNEAIGRWTAASDVEAPITKRDVHTGSELSGNSRYNIIADAPNMEFRLPQVPAGMLSIRLASGSKHPVRITQFDPDLAHDLLFEDFTVSNEFTIPVSRLGREVVVERNNIDNKWQIYRDWEAIENFDYLDDVQILVESGGTNAGSRVDIKFFDKEGIQYPPGDFTHSYDLASKTGGASLIVTDKAFTGSIGLGHNKAQGPAIFKYNGESPNGFSAITAQGFNGGAAADVSINFQDTNLSLDYASAADVALVDWTTKPERTIDAAAPWSTEMEYVDEENLPFSITVPLTGGPYVFASGETGENGKTYNAFYAANRAAADSVPALADDAATVSEFALMNFIGAVAPPKVLLGRLAPVAKVVSDPANIPTTEAASSRILYQGATFSQIYQYDNSGANPTPVTDPGAADWSTGTRVRDNETENDYRYNRAANQFVLVASSDVLPPYIEPFLTGAQAGELRLDYNSVHVISDSMNAAVGGNGELFMPEPPVDDQGDAVDTPEMFVEMRADNAVNWTLEDQFGVQFVRPDGSDQVTTLNLLAGTTWGFRLSAAEQAWVYREVLPSSGGDGLRGAPVNDTPALTALPAKDDELRRVGSKRYQFELGATSGDLADDAGTGFWSEVKIYGTVASNEIGLLKQVPNVTEAGAAKTNADYVADGLLPLVNGYRLTDGATDNPKFALMFPAFVSGDDLLVPSTFDGRFVRNLGGNAAAFMASQADGTAVNGLRTLRTYVQSDWNGQSNNDYGKGSGSLTGAANNGVGMSSADPETRPHNFAMQFCLVLDSHIKTLFIEADGIEVDVGGVADGDNAVFADDGAGGFKITKGTSTAAPVQEGTPLNAGSTRHYVVQWDGAKFVNTLVKEVWTEGTQGTSGYRKYMIDHLLGHARIAGRNVITSSGTISWNLDFAMASAYVFAHDLREAQAETASIRVNSRTVNSLQYTLHDSVGTGDGGSNVQFELSGDL